MHLIFKILAESAAPRMIRILSVRKIVRNAVNSVSFEETGILSRYEVCNCVREILTDLVSVVRIKSYVSLGINFCLARLGGSDSVAIANKRVRAVARASFVSKRNYEFKRSIRNVNDGLRHCFVELHLYKATEVKLKAELIALGILAGESLVDLLAVSLEFNVTVFGNQFKVNYVNRTPFR